MLNGHGCNVMSVLRGRSEGDVAMVPLTDAWARRELKLGVRNLESLSVTARQMLEHLTAREGNG